MSPGTPFLEVTLFGLAAGAVIGLLGLGLVLIYRTTGVLNFAHWAIGIMGVVGYILLVGAGLPAPLAALAAIPISVVAGVLSYRLVFRGVGRGNQLIVVLIAIGVAQLFSAVAALALRFEAFSSVRTWLPVADWRLFGASVRSTDVVTAITAVGLAFGFLAWFRISRTGRALRAVAQNREAAQLAGIDESRYSQLAWGIGSALSALALLLVLPHAGGDEGGTLTVFHVSPLGTLLIPAFGAALVGGLVHLPMTLVGGFIFGLAQELLILAPKPLSDLRTSIAAILIVVLLLLRTERFFGTRQEMEALEA